MDIARLAEINRRLGMPIVLHGGSGIPDDQVRAAVKHGIAKMNVATDYHQAYYQAVAEVMRSDAAGGHMVHLHGQGAGTDTALFDGQDEAAVRSGDGVLIPSRGAG